MSATAISDGRSELAELLERVRNAKGSDRRLEIDLWRALDGGEEAYAAGRVPLTWLCTYTASIDAALAFALRIVPDANCHGYEKGEWGVDAYLSRNNVPDGHWLVDARGETVPLAFIAAALNRLTALTQEHSDHVHP